MECEQDLSEKINFMSGEDQHHVTISTSHIALLQCIRDELIRRERESPCHAERVTEWHGVSLSLNV